MSMRPERIEVSGQVERPKRKPGENIWDYWKRLDQEQAATDLGFAERLEIAQNSSTEVLIEGGGIPEDKGRTMPWNK